MEDNNNFNYNSGYNQGPYGPGQRYEPEMTLKDWIITVLLSSIPCVNIILLLIWAFSAGNQTRTNYAKAMLIVSVGFIILSTALSFILAPLMMASFSQFYY